MHTALDMKTIIYKTKKIVSALYILYITLFVFFALFRLHLKQAIDHQFLFRNLRL
jgi:hypothetical protein